MVQRLGHSIEFQQVRFLANQPPLDIINRWHPKANLILVLAHRVSRPPEVQLQCLEFVDASLTRRVPRLELAVRTEPEIAQVMVYGDRRPHLVALIVPDDEFASAWTAENNKDGGLAALIDDTDFIKTIGEAVDRVNGKLSVIERVRKFVLTVESFTIENRMLTPSMKIRRHIIREKYGNALDTLYGK